MFTFASCGANQSEACILEENWRKGIAVTLYRTKPPITSNFSVWSSIVKPLRPSPLLYAFHATSQYYRTHIFRIFRPPLSLGAYVLHRCSLTAFIIWRRKWVPLVSTSGKSAVVVLHSFFLCLCPQGGSANEGELDVASIRALRFWL